MHRAALAFLATIALAACGSDDTPNSDAERFCGEAIDNRAALVTPPSTPAEAEAVIEFYRLMGDLAPLSIAEDWAVVLISLETAAELVPGDPDSEQLVAMTALAAEPSAFSVQQWLLRNCGLQLPITTIAPQENLPARTTTIAPPETTVPDDG